MLSLLCQQRMEFIGDVQLNLIIAQAFLRSGR
nr:MAG TPA_asm: Mini-ribonuclease 3 [Caudoviricetes sp.]